MSETDPNHPEPLVNPFTGQVIRFVEETEDRLVMESTYRAGGAPAPPHLHPSQEERFEVIEGGVRANVEGAEHTLRAGDELLVPAGTMHDFGGLSDEGGSVVWEVRPPLRTWEFFTTLFGALQATAEAQEAGIEPEVTFDFADWSDVFRTS
jgi:quercetin dioxygenase-like cupin family protein